MNYPTVTRLDVSFVVLWQTNSLILPIFDHWNLVVLILRFIEGDTRKGLVYKNRGNKEFIAYIDAYWIESPSNRRSTSGQCVLFKENLISWKIKKEVWFQGLVLKQW
jgi:hypothetical protein